MLACLLFAFVFDRNNVIQDKKCWSFVGPEFKSIFAEVLCFCFSLLIYHTSSEILVLQHEHVIRETCDHSAENVPHRLGQQKCLLIHYILDTLTLKKKRDLCLCYKHIV